MSPTLPAGSLTGQHVPRRSRIRPDQGRHGSQPNTRCTSTPNRRGTGSTCAWKAQSCPTDHRSGDGDVPQKPRTAVQQHEADVQRGVAGADRQPARVRYRDGHHELRALHRHVRVRRPFEQHRRHRVPSPLPFALTPEAHQSASGQRGRQDLLHAQPRAGGRPAVSVADQDGPAGGPRRADPVGAAVRRTAGEQRRMLAGQPDRRRRGGSGLGSDALLVLRAGLPDRALRRRAVRYDDRDAPASPDRSTSAAGRVIACSAAGRSTSIRTPPV